MTRITNRRAATSLFFGVCNVGLMMLALGGNSVSAPQMKSEIKVREPRPLAAAILVLESRIKAPITYEDPPYRFSGDLEVSPVGPLIPKTGSIELTYSSRLEPDEIIRSLVEANNRQGNPGVFELKAAGGFRHVVPVKFRNEKGELIEYRSILETRLSQSFQNLSGVDILDGICNELSEKLNEKVVVGMIPPRPFSAAHETFRTANRTARECLAELIEKTGYNLSWQVFYDPKLKWYVLNIHPVGYSGQGPQ